MSSRNFFILICVISYVCMSKCVPLDQQPSTIIDEKLAANEPSVDTATVAMESETTNMIQENEIDSKMVREEATTDAAAEQSQQEEETTTSPIASQPKVMFDPAMMKKQLIEHFRKQLTVSAVRAIFLVLNELKRRQNMVHSQQQDVSESRIVESSVRSDGCECRCNPAVNNHDEDETEVVIIDKTSSRKRKEGKSLNRYLPKSKSDESKNRVMEQHEEYKVEPVCESCRVKGIEERLLKY